MFSAGDVVRLKSGGANMTVVEAKATQANCIWHDAEWHLQVALLDFAVLAVC